jgi:surface polysaccharide O-acyltransferase-like enzyme
VTGERAPPPPPRLSAVEWLRVAGCVAVIIIHATPFNRGGGLGQAWNAATVANQLARFAVPAFFVLSGYFWAHRTPTPRAVRAVTVPMVGRLLLLFAAWSVVYGLPFDGGLFTHDVPHAYVDQLARNARWIASHPGTVLLQGTNGHLWFLPALASAITVAALLRGALPAPVAHRAMAVVALVAWAVALLAGPYARTRWGLHLPFNPRNGPAFALPCVVAGGLLARGTPSARWVAMGAALLVGGAWLSAAELSWLREAHRVRLTQDYVAGTLAVGVGAAMVALANPRWLHGARVAALGPAVLGIYLVHPMMVDLLQPATRRLPPLPGDAALLAAVFLLSLGATRLLQRHPRTRWLVSTR